MGSHFAGTPIFIRGTGGCTMYDNASENLSYVCLGPDPC
jgi:hypothetical protein